MPGYLMGWKEIEKYLGMTRHVALRRGYPVRRQPKSAGVWADPADLDAHTDELFSASEDVVSESRPRLGAPRG